MAERVATIEREARLRLLEDILGFIRQEIPGRNEPMRAALRPMQDAYRAECEAAALDLTEEEPPQWLRLAGSKIVVQWAERVARRAAPA